MANDKQQSKEDDKDRPPTPWRNSRAKKQLAKELISNTHPLTRNDKGEWFIKDVKSKFAQSMLLCVNDSSLIFFAVLHATTPIYKSYVYTRFKQNANYLANAVMTYKSRANNAPPGILKGALDDELDFVRQQMDHLGVEGVGFEEPDDAPGEIPSRGVPGIIPGLNRPANKLTDAVLQDIKLRGSDRESEFRFFGPQ